MRKKTLLHSAVIGLFAITPAFAHGFYDNHDRDHDGRWNYNEFRGAQNDWHNQHHDHQYGERELQNHFRNLDRDHDGYVNREQVRSFHNWF